MIEYRVLKVYIFWYFDNFYILIGLVKVSIVVEGEDDLKGIGWILIKVNGIEWLLMFWGYNIVILDSDRNFIMVVNFDMVDLFKGEGVKMGMFL